ncbi:oxysterol-binding protein-related protein 1 isoform X3 [Xenopus tropicalis]|uniref:Oxysterol-binding protein n=1 Tax=Xenopus tropicalis TaxID=8364 RepID=A0A8J0T1W6_XENTR|nr:oxysterol-binding protein-related protein 1 isoform X3 [Xenopus tropicalis]|eukprot:XP_017950546.1 PREDICTED: oxysterol-binding protein-related protein 1 isoform X4 [Xenopus tropicalis]
MRSAMNSEADEQLLHDARNGNLEEVRELLESNRKGQTVVNIDCKGKSKSNLGWTPLHLTCYFGHGQVVKDLLMAGAAVNVQNDMGDTPLHRAAFTGRKDIVMLLLEYGADTTVINGEGQTAKDMTHDKEIKTMLEAAQRTQEIKLEEMLLAAAREGNILRLSELLNKPKPPNINCTDQMGNTPLHCAAYRGLKHCALKLLKCGADVNARNKTNQRPIDLAQQLEIKQVLQSRVVKHVLRNLQRFDGALCKSSRFFGWRVFWVVLEHGVISWYQKQADAINNTYRQGCKHLTQAVCTLKSTDRYSFSVKCFDDSIHYFKILPKNLKHTREYDAQQQSSFTTKHCDWLTAIEEHSAYSTHYCSQDQLSDDEDEELVLVGDLKQSLENAQTSLQRLNKEVSQFAGGLTKWEGAKDIDPIILQQLTEVSEASQDTYKALNNCLLLFTKQEAVRNLKLEHEQEKNKILSEALQTLATEHHELEKSLVKGTPPLHTILSEDEFYDAVSDSDSDHSLSGFETVTSSSPDGSLNLSYNQQVSMSEEKKHGGGGGGSTSNGIKKHRTSLPSPMFSRNDFSIWSILRKCIGMELSKITMPVIFNEPLSFLQRLSEYMEHTYLIHKANQCSDTVERMQCVAAFAVSAVASQWERTGKPFNPLLGETYELVREDLGFRLISEQVSHHPPVSAFHAEGINNDFVFHGSIYPKLKFWGKSVEAEPKGIITLELLKHKEAYTWTNPTCCVHNIIVGKLWIEQYGNMEITNHKTGEKCILNFKPSRLFDKELHKVEGYIQDKSKKKLCSLYGKWTECLYTTDPATFDAFKKNDKKEVEEKQAGNAEEPDEMPLPDSESVQVIPGSTQLWRIAPRPPNSAQMYNFTNFALALNEFDKDMEGTIPKTDCRLRPDIRAMENGEIDSASEEKKRLEEKQRAARKSRSKTDEEWKTRWFRQGPNPYNGSQDWLYSGNYWDRNYSNLPDIY